MSKLKIKMLPLQAHCFAFGGFEIQMLELFNALKGSNEIEVEKMNPWSTDEDFDVIHLWGLEPANFNNAYWAKKAGKKVVLTALIGQVENLIQSLRFRISAKLGNVRSLLKVLEHIDSLVVVNELEAKKAVDYFKLEKRKVFVIPNLIPEAAVKAQGTITDKVSLFDSYFLCAGNISERKNQLLLAEAALEANVNIVFAGNFICNDSYRQRFLDLVSNSSQIKYVGNLESSSIELYKLFKASSGFCLPSYQETQPISVLEAAFFNKNIMIGNQAYSRQSMFSKLLKVDPSSKVSIRKGLERLNSERSNLVYSISKENLDKCLYTNVSQAYIKVYYS